jgi:hypothetical protein
LAERSRRMGDRTRRSMAWLANIRVRIAEAAHRLAELENCAPDHAMSAMLIVA